MDFKVGDYVVRTIDWLDNYEVGYIFKIKEISLAPDHINLNISDGYCNHDDRNLRMATTYEILLCDLGIKNIKDVIPNETEI